MASRPACPFGRPCPPYLAIGGRCPPYLLPCCQHCRGSTYEQGSPLEGVERRAG